ncbi:zf-c3hc4 type zinc finger [Lentinula edodes]|uniref:Zf-c3hc4 type zinc finger n=1 Tax=Lentinula edodes TaxID=5353 RepID=A0A1Q3EMM1_LENED|nr:zf-c3hc4 type zinc finger [Lentinula edodes]
MGNSSSSSSRSHDETVDFGFLTPQGVYTGPRDWNQAVVTQLICARRLAPFYRPLEDYDDSWTDDQILAARKELPDSEGGLESASRSEPLSASSISSKSSSHSKRPNTLKEPSKPEAAVYRGATECPICFLYYPQYINHSSEPTTTHLVSEPAACPYCVQENFGVVYTPPPWRAGIGSEGSLSPRSISPKQSQQSLDHPAPTHKRRQKSFSADSPEVVTTDQIRPDWEAKLAAVRAAVTRRANRRIIMRQVGDRLIPVGVTSGRVLALSPEEAASAASGGDNGGGSWRPRRRQQGGNGLEQYLGQDLEEIMMMEAMRLSLLEHEAQQRKEAEEKKKADAQANKVTDDHETNETVTSSTSSNGASTSSAPNLNSIDLSSTSPLSSSSSSTPAQQKNDSLRVKRGSLFNRSRSPSPAPPSSQSSLQNTPPFSTLGAALSTASTASAILRSSSSTSASSDPSPEKSSQAPLLAKEVTSPSTIESASTSSLPSNTSSSTTSPVPPSITIAPVPSSAPIFLPPASPTPLESHSASKRPPSINTPFGDNDSSYENLPSSPEEIPEETPCEPLIPKDGTKMETELKSDPEAPHEFVSHLYDA